MEYIQGFSRNQLQMMSFDQYVSQDSWARIVDLFVDILPMEELGFRATPGSEGRPPYNPCDMLKLYLYGYKNQIRSSRKLAHACEVNMEVIWLLNPHNASENLLRLQTLSSWSLHFFSLIHHSYGYASITKSPMTVGFDPS